MCNLLNNVIGSYILNACCSTLNFSIMNVFSLSTLTSNTILLTSCKDPLIDNDHFLLLLMQMYGLGNYNVVKGGRKKWKKCWNIDDQSFFSYISYRRNNLYICDSNMWIPSHN
jgi:hypothetical protein